MNAPITYFEWAEVIDQLATGEKDPEVLEAMRNGSLEWQAGVSARFVKMLMEVVDDRLNEAVTKFQSTIRGGDINSLTIGISALRRDLIYLRDVVSIDAIPADNRAVLVDHVINFSKQIQTSLESSAQSDNTGKLLSILKNNPVTITRTDSEGDASNRDEGDD